MSVSSNVANDGPPASDRVMESRSGQGSPHVGISSQHEYHLNDRTLNMGYDSELELKRIEHFDI